MTRAARRGKKVRFHYSLYARRDGSREPAGRFRASSEMIKHYDRFIGGHDSTVNHRREQREATRGSLNDRCRGRTLDRRDVGHPRWELFVFPPDDVAPCPPDISG